MAVLYANLFVIAVGTFSLRRTHQELGLSGKRSFLTALLVWVAYITHTAVSLWASWATVWPLQLDRTLARGVGGALVIAGLAILVAGMVEFGSLARMSGRCPDRLVRDGVYRWSRNPQNVGWGLALLGIAIYGRSAGALLLAVEFWAAFRLYIPREEQFLKGVYGEGWDQYRDATPRFLGVPRDFIYTPLSLNLPEPEPEASTSDSAQAQ